MLRETLLQETILFNNPQAESSRLEQDCSINKNESNNQHTIVETVIEQRGKEIYKPCSVGKNVE